MNVVQWGWWQRHTQYEGQPKLIMYNIHKHINLNTFIWRTSIEIKNHINSVTMEQSLLNRKYIYITFQHKTDSWRAWCKMKKRITSRIYTVTSSICTTFLEFVMKISCYIQQSLYWYKKGLFSYAYNGRVCIRGSYQWHKLLFCQYSLGAEVVLFHLTCTTMCCKEVSYFLTF